MYTPDPHIPRHIKSFLHLFAHESDRAYEVPASVTCYWKILFTLLLLCCCCFYYIVAACCRCYCLSSSLSTLFSHAASAITTCVLTHCRSYCCCYIILLSCHCAFFCWLHLLLTHCRWSYCRRNYYLFLHAITACCYCYCRYYIALTTVMLFHFAGLSSFNSITLLTDESLAFVSDGETFCLAG